ncbi:MAG: CRISPR-associated protein Cas4 [Clostridia bacterium]|nr:CRISPR-associated protein Cas4 [Clostridia bacterium]
MEYNEDSYLMLSGVQHFAFCRRQWALIHIDNVWVENERTTEGKLLHDNAHDAYRSESRGEVIISRAMPIFSRTMGLSGECDVVEFRKNSAEGIALHGKDGFYTVYPVEYKRGTPKENPCDMLQLTAQAMCLEEMMCCNITEGALYYFETRHRVKVSITDELRDTVHKYAAEMHEYYERQYLPRPKRTKACNACSLKELCLPKLEKIQSAKAYNDENLGRNDL